MTKLWEVTCDRTTFFSINIQADTEEEAIDLATQAPIHEWDENNTEGSLPEAEEVSNDN